jgi:hypothetical protein
MPVGSKHDSDRPPARGPLPDERKLYDDYVPLAKPVFDLTADHLRAKIRGLPVSE